MTFALALDLARQALAGGLGLCGVAFVLLGVLGLLRFPDLFARTHAFGVVSGAGAMLILLALAVLDGHWTAAVRLGVLALVIAAAAPAIAHLTAGAAHAAGLSPIAGPYSAPRPGASIRRAPP